MIHNINGPTQQAARETDVVYKHLHQYARNELPSEVIQEFINLLLLTKKTNSKISQALETIASSTSQQQFNTVLNNCCWIILDCWLDTSELRTYSSQLLDIFNLVTQTNSYNRHRKQLVRSIQDYYQSESYFQLKIAIAIINPEEIKRSQLITLLTEEMTDSSDRYTDSIDIYLSRYAYLYHDFIPKDIQAKTLTSLLEKLQEERQKEFEILLSQHIIYRFRLKHLARMKLLSKANNIITKVDNPSLLSYRAFITALKQYSSKIDGYTLSERARLFVAENKLRISYRVFKQDLYRFIIDGITPINSTFKFKNKLKAKLENIFAESNDKPLNRTLVVQTCRQLFSFLIIDSADSNNAIKITELIANLGTAQTTLILTKIALICPESQIDLKNKICSLTAHYQSREVRKIDWLIKILEHLLISLSICFGNIDVSIATMTDEQ